MRRPRHREVKQGSAKSRRFRTLRSCKEHGALNPGSQVLVLLTPAAPRPPAPQRCKHRTQVVGNPGEKGRGDREAGKCLDRVALAQSTEGSGEKPGTGRKKAPEREVRAPHPQPRPGDPLKRGGGQAGTGLFPEMMRAGRG